MMQCYVIRQLRETTRETRRLDGRSPHLPPHFLALDSPRFQCALPLTDPSAR
jgi:hypothetical protein